MHLLYADVKYPKGLYNYSKFINFIYLYKPYNFIINKDKNKYINGHNMCYGN